MLADLRYAVRSFLRTPGFTVAAVLSIAIGVGANTAIYSVASALLLHPLPYKDAERLTILWNRSPGLGIAEDWFSTAQYFDIKNGHTGFEEVAIAIGGSYNLTGEGGEPERIGTIRMSPNLLPMLGARALHGRLLSADDEKPNRTGVAVLGYGTWMRRYGGNPQIVGRTILLNSRPFEVVGVLERRFSLPREVMPTLDGAENAEIVLPLPLGADAASQRNHEDYNIIGTLKPGVTVAAAQAEADVITARLRREHPDLYPPNGGLTFSIVPLLEQVVGDVRRAVLVLVGSVAFVLLIACANVANLQLARSLARQKEIAVRAALGASAGRIVRQLLAESVLLALAGGAVGVGFAVAGLAFIRALGTQSVPRLGEISLNGEVLVFTLVVSIVAGVLFGFAPALRVGGAPASEGLRSAERGASTTGSVWGRGNRTRRALIAAELALAVVILVAAGLLVRSFTRLQQVSPGFDASRALTFEVNANNSRYRDALSIVDAYRQLCDRLARLPGVTATGAVSALPLSQMFSWGPITVEGRPAAPGEAFINADERMVAGDYFAALRIPLRSGRLFDEHDTPTSQRVVIVDEWMASQLWPGESALGKRLKTGGADSTSPWLTVVGVVGRVKQYTLDSDSRIAMYFPHAQYPARGMNVVVRTANDPLSASRAVRDEVRRLDPDMPVFRMRTMEARVGESLARRRFAMLLLTLFAGLALGLAVVGVYGVMAYLLSQGTRELGIRLALGASPRGILLMIVGRGMSVACLGLAVGLGSAAVLTRYMAAMLFHVEPRDPLTFTLIPGLLALAALAASYAPARRAARIDPMISLRSE